MNRPDRQHQTDDSDLIQAFSLLEGEQVKMRADFDQALRRSLYDNLASQSLSPSIGDRIAGLFGVLRGGGLRPVMTAAAFAIIVLFAAGAYLGAQLYSIGGGANYATLELTSGSVTVSRAVHIFGNIELSRALTVAPGESLQIWQGDSLISDQETVAQLVLPDQSRVQVGPQTELKLTDLQARSASQPLAIAMHLQRGAVRTEVEHLQSEKDRFQVSTPDLIATVKGTIFRLDVGAAGTRVATDEGLVRVNYDGHAIDVAAGRELSLLLNEKATAIDVRPQSPQLYSEVLANLDSFDDNGRQVIYTNAMTIPWQIRALPNVNVLFYVNEALYERVATDAKGLAVVEFSPPDETEYRIYAVTEMLTAETSLPSPEKVIRIDRTPPSLVLQEPTEPQVTQDSVVVAGLTEPQVTLTINGEPVSVDEAGQFRYTLALEPGDNELDLVASDLAGNTIRLGSVIVYE